MPHVKRPFKALLLTLLILFTHVPALFGDHNTEDGSTDNYRCVSQEILSLKKNYALPSLIVAIIAIVGLRIAPMFGLIPNPYVHSCTLFLTFATGFSGLSNVIFLSLFISYIVYLAQDIGIISEGQQYTCAFKRNAMIHGEIHYCRNNSELYQNRVIVRIIVPILLAISMVHYVYTMVVSSTCLSRAYHGMKLKSYYIMVSLAYFSLFLVLFMMLGYSPHFHKKVSLRSLRMRCGGVYGSNECLLDRQSIQDQCKLPECDLSEYQHELWKILDDPHPMLNICKLQSIN